MAADSAHNANVRFYDIIGDIHGHADKLLRLLAKLGYSDTGGVFRHPSREAIFVGDFIDRGPDVRETLKIVRAMIDAGAARAVLGNHEVNAIIYQATGDQRLKAGLRDTLEQFSGHDAEWAEYIEWFRSLPLYLDIDDLRVVHAVWDSNYVATVESHQRGLGRGFWDAVLKDGGALERAVMVLTNGWRVPLPGSTVVVEFEGSTRSFIRVAWWKTSQPLTFRSASLPFDPSLTEAPLPEHVQRELLGYGVEEPPVFFGHYALPPDLTPWPMADNIACVNYRAAKKGPLVAYRWDGEARLKPGKFVSSAD